MKAAKECKKSGDIKGAKKYLTQSISDIEKTEKAISKIPNDDLTTNLIGNLLAFCINMAKMIIITLPAIIAINIKNKKDIDKLNKDAQDEWKSTADSPIAHITGTSQLQTNIIQNKLNFDAKMINNKAQTKAAIVGFIGGILASVSDLKQAKENIMSGKKTSNANLYKVKMIKLLSDMKKKTKEVLITL